MKARRCVSIVLAGVFVLVGGACSSAPESSSSPTAPATSTTTVTSETLVTDTVAATTATITAATESTADGVLLPDRVVCHTQYRPDVSSLDGAEEPSLTVERDDYFPFEIGTVVFEAMTLSATFVGDVPDGRSVHIVVTTAGGDESVSVLYQIGLDSIDFSGSQGFTGLHYVNSGPAQLQFWCTAE